MIERWSEYGAETCRARDRERVIEHELTPDGFPTWLTAREEVTRALHTAPDG